MNAFRLILVCVLMLFTAACDSGEDSTPEPATAEPTAVVTEEATESPDPADVVAQATEEAAATDDPAVTPEPTLLQSTSAGGEYSVSVSYTVDAAEDDPIGAPPEGQRWIIVVATLANQQGEAVTVAADHLALVDTENNRYSPEPPDENTQPPMVTAELAEGESVLGLARFAIPETAVLAHLEWCPGGECETPLASPF